MPQSPGNKPTKIVYITRDLERALGMEPGPNYHIVTNRTAYAESKKGQYPGHITLIDEGEGLLSTVELMAAKATGEVVRDNAASVLVFKNTLQIEKTARDKGWTLENPSASLAEKIENKISQVAWLGDLAEEYLPPHKIAPARELTWDKKPIIIQWAHGHTGESTIPVNSANELALVQKAFPDREARATDLLSGPSFTVNVVVTDTTVLPGNISYQITGLPPFTDNPFTTIGNDWSLTHSLLAEAEIERIDTMCRKIGEKMRTEGWRGLFGIDVMRDDSLDKIFLIEINARQPASTTFESFLQNDNRRAGLVGMTTFEAHIAALAGTALTASAPATTAAQTLIQINDGAQIIERVTKTVGSVDASVIGSLELAGYMTIPYDNTAYNSDLLRVLSRQGIMETHNKFNKRGKEISAILG